MKCVVLHRTESFSSAHSLSCGGLTAQQNEDIFQKCTRIHGHNYKVQVSIKGPVNPATGMVISLALLKDWIQTAILGPFDHRHIERDVPFFTGPTAPPSTAENLAIFFYDELNALLKRHIQHILKKVEAEGDTLTATEAQCILYSVCVHETDKNVATYYGPHDSIDIIRRND